MKSLKVGAKTYSIHVDSTNKLFLEQKEIHGYIDYTQRDIVVNGAVHATFIAENLVHEILHAIIDDAALQDVLIVDDEFMEKVVSALTPRVLQLFVDNRSLQADIIDVFETR